MFQPGFLKSAAGRLRRAASNASLAGLIGAAALAGCGGSGSADTGTTPPPPPPPPAGLSLLKTAGTQWVDADGKQVLLKGTNLGNWLVQEFWMMGQGGNGVTDQCTLEAKLTERFGYSEKERLIQLFRDSWITARDWDQLKAFGFNVVRLPILWSVIEDEKKPRTLRADAWKYLDASIAEAKKRGMYVILDLHGAHGGQTPNDHTGCAGQNKYWTDTDAQDRTRWVWQQIATKYKDEPAVAAYDPLNEPWGSTTETCRPPTENRPTGRAGRRTALASGHPRPVNRLSTPCKPPQPTASRFSLRTARGTAGIRTPVDRSARRPRPVAPTENRPTGRAGRRAALSSRHPCPVNRLSAPPKPLRPTASRFSLRTARRAAGIRWSKRQRTRAGRTPDARTPRTASRTRSGRHMMSAAIGRSVR